MVRTVIACVIAFSAGCSIPNTVFKPSLDGGNSMVPDGSVPDASMPDGSVPDASMPDASGASLHVQNDSDFIFVELYLTSVGSSDWGPDLLGDDVLLPGESVILGLQCGVYDARLVDLDAVECEIHELDLCMNDAVWIINNNTCTAFNSVKAAKEPVGRGFGAGP